MGGRGSGSFTAGNVTLAAGGGASGGTDDFPAGWTPQAGQRAVNKQTTIDYANSRIQGQDHETMVIVDQNGYAVAVVQGGKHSVGITPNAEKHIKGNDVLHNHPNGGSLSTTDVITAGKCGCRSISATSRSTKKTYTLTATSKANGEGLAKAMSKSEKKIIDKWQQKANSMAGKKYKDEASYKKQLNKHYDNIIGDWMSKNASKYGYTYTVK